MDVNFDRLMSECETLSVELRDCTDPKKRLTMLKQMKNTLDAASKIASELPPITQDEN